ncbi:oxidoreductase-like protein [Mycena epipterygia]|nr:oxidoreductase-like protein [Mycena epipterygia]
MLALRSANSVLLFSHLSPSLVRYCGPASKSLRRYSKPASLLRYSSTTGTSSTAIERLKNPSRGGQNLSLRYRRLEQSLRGKEALQRDIDIRARAEGGGGGTILQSPTEKDDSRYFRGLEVPQRPRAPESDECCMSGCAVCVYDLYEESLGAYRDSLQTLRATLAAAGIPEASWPDNVRLGQRPEGKPVGLSAFEELERALREKHAATDKDKDDNQ